VGRKFEELYKSGIRGPISDSDVTRVCRADYPSGRFVFRVMPCGSSLTFLLSREEKPRKALRKMRARAA